MVHQTPNILRYSPRSLIREKKASHFPSVSEEKILKNKQRKKPLNTKKATKFGVSVFNGKFLFFYGKFIARAWDRLRKTGCETCFCPDFKTFLKELLWKVLSPAILIIKQLSPSVSVLSNRYLPPLWGIIVNYWKVASWNVRSWLSTKRCYSHRGADFFARAHRGSFVCGSNDVNKQSLALRSLKILFISIICCGKKKTLFSFFYTTQLCFVFKVCFDAHYFALRYLPEVRWGSLFNYTTAGQK